MLSRRASLTALAVAVFVSVGAAAAGAVSGAGLDPQRSSQARTASETTPEADRRGQQALSSLDYPWRELGYTIEFRDYERGRLGSANSRTKRIVIYVKREQSTQSLRITIAHEIGHALDFEHGTARRHDEYRVIRGLRRSGPWYPCDGCTDYSSHAGDWSEVFAYWLAGPGDFRSRVGGPPTKDQLRRLGPLFAVPRKQAAASPRATPTPSPSPSSSPVPRLPVSGNAVPTIAPPGQGTQAVLDCLPGVSDLLPPVAWHGTGELEHLMPAAPADVGAC